ncbi:unnamed protein product [Spodoptera littoralis]|uniref:DNA ligase n=1 Tax=Spodoptera littoralis TaxID=7109 RepID=A0A9P0I4C6_SPOLI|nr:unnamed protein product [Spodoptera littoralis]CAH1640878.1 unnamed protein product [Spodoptera littoralis]
MSIVLKVLVPCRLALQVQQSATRLLPRHLHCIPTNLTYVGARTMAQRSITSFFKVTPSKPLVKEELPDKDNDTVSGGSSPGSPENGKTTKRPRLESSDSDLSPKKKQQNPADTKQNKKKVKRQRIESSGSEAEASPESNEPLVNTAPPTSLSPDKPQIKIEKQSPKTYQSPKSKKKKPLTEPNGIKKSPSPKKDKKENSTAESKRKSIEKEDKSEEKSNELELSSPEQLVPEAEYDPSKARYHPVRDACWARGRPVPYLALARTLELVEATSARLKIIDTLANYLRSVLALTPEDLLPSVYLCLNQLAPAYEGLELGVAESYLMKAVAGSTGRTLAQVRAGVAREGDLGRVAEAARAAQRTMFPAPPLTLRGVFAALHDIARTTGQASMNKKISKIQTLYVACRHSEARYLIRSLEGKLRIGLAEQSVLQALAVAVALTPPGPGGVTQLDASEGMSPEEFKSRVEWTARAIKATYCQCPHYGRVLAALQAHGAAGLAQHVRLQPGIPLKPMLAHPSKNVSHIFDRFEREQFTCEWKYDGERAQIHVPARGAAPHLPGAAVFSRNQEDNTSKYPDVLRRLPALLKDSVTSCVLDCEAVAYDTVNKQILPFQILSTRKRKDAREEDIRVQVCVYVFDLLYLNGEPTVHRPLAERRELLREHFQETPGEWQFATSRDCTSVEEVQQFMEEAVKNSCEGLMVKALTGDQSQYDIARRSHNWLKLKKDYLEGMGDTLDLVVIGAYLGRGKRAGLYGGFLLACRDPDSEQFQALCKLGTGFTDDDLRDLTNELRPLALAAPRAYYCCGAAPDVWLDAARVWELRGADLSLSPAHRAAIGRVAPDKGISLRFPRFVRARPDKRPEQATTSAQVADMYLAQDQVKNSAATANNYDDFY